MVSRTVVMFVTISLHYAASCPTSIIEWTKRTNNYICRDGSTYHCILTANETTVEICMNNFILVSGELGCPRITFRDKVPIRVSPNFPCNATGCPPVNNRGYRSDMLYLYPTCFLKSEYRLNMSTKSSHSEEMSTSANSPQTGSSSSTEIHIFQVLFGLSLSIVLVLFSVIIVRILRSRKRKRKRMANSGDVDDEERELLPVNDHLENGIDINTNEKGCHEDINEGVTFKVNGDIAYTEFIPGHVKDLLTDILSINNFAWLCGISGSGKTSAALWYGCVLQRKSSESVTWKCSSDDRETFLESLKLLSRYIGIHNEDSIEKDVTKSELDKCANQIRTELEKRNARHAVLFENVVEETVDYVVAFIDHLNSEKIKCIVSTQNVSLFLKRKGKFNENNLIKDFNFQEEDVRHFFESDSQTQEDTLMLGNLLSYFPAALKSARSYMESTKLSAKAVSERFKECASTRSLNAPSNGDNMRLFQSLLTIVQDVKENEHDMYTLMLYLPFLEKRDIPLYLFNYLQTWSNPRSAENTTDKFVQFMHKYSFGNISGVDQQRRLHTHQVLCTVMREEDSPHEREEHLAILFECFAQLLCKEQDQDDDRQRCIELLPHARHAFTVGEKNVQSDDLSTLLGKSMVSERIYYTYLAMGNFTYSREWIGKSIQCIYDIIGTSLDKICKEEKIDLHVRDFFQDSSNIARRIFSILENKINDNAEGKLAQFAERYILNKHRHKHELHKLQNAVPSLFTKRMRFGDKELEGLKRWNFAIVASNKDIALLFLVEAVVLIFLSYGLRELSEKSILDSDIQKKICTENARKELCLERHQMLLHVYVAFEIGKILSERFQGFPPHCSFQSNVNGIMEIVLSDMRDGSSDRSGKLKDIAKILQGLLKTESKYYLNGICIREWNDQNFQLVCRKQLMRCYQCLAEISTEEKEQNAYSEEADHQAEEMKDIFESYRQKIHLIYQGQEMKHTLAKYLFRRNKVDDAICLLQNVHEIDPERPGTFVTHKDLEDIMLLKWCYDEAKRHNEIDDLRQKVKQLRGHINEDFAAAYSLYEALCEKFDIPTTAS